MINSFLLYAHVACFALFAVAQNVDWKFPPSNGPTLTFPASSSLDVKWSAATFSSPSLILWCPDFSSPPNYYKREDYLILFGALDELITKYNCLNLDYDSQVPPIGNAVVSLDFIGNGDFMCHFELVPTGAEHGGNSNAFVIARPDEADQIQTTYGDSATVTEEITQPPTTVTKAAAGTTTSESPGTVTVEPPKTVTAAHSAPSTVVVQPTNTLPTSSTQASSTSNGVNGRRSCQGGALNVELALGAVIAIIMT